MTRSRLILCTGSALAALSTALVMSAPVHAQGLLANGNVVGGNANAQISTSANQTNVLVNANQAIIDWRPTTGTDGATINVLPEGNSLFFDANQGVTDFTVLNRIELTDDIGAIDFRPVELSGTVQSRIGNGFGGNVWFYSPGGILVGATGRFDVGGLVLTTNPIDVTDGLFGSNGEIRFRGTAGSPYSVSVNAGAQINALATGSYVAMVAPSIVMNGRVNVDGSVAYVGAEQADLRINGGLFDIAITVGTSQAHGVEHNGVTTGPASTSADDAQRAIMVAVPKNQAMTMLLSGSIGYTAATDVTLEGSAVVLSAGHDIRNGAIWTRSPANEVGGIAIGSSIVSSAITGQATGTIAIEPAAGGTTTFQSTASFGAPGGISLLAGDGQTIRALQGLTLTSTTGPVGGSISMTANRGVIDITPGALTLNARGDSSFDGDSTGGTITLSTIAGGRIAAGQIDADAGASAGASLDATGGSVTLATSLGGIIASPFTNLRASGDALFSAGEPGPDAGDGTGGTITIRSGAGSLMLGDVNAVAQGTGGIASSGQAGAATGGDIVIDIAAGTHQWSSLFADVSTAAGYTTQDGTSGGAQGGATGISVNLTGSETTLDITRSVSLYADGRAFGGGATAAAVRGGKIAVATGDGGTLQIAQDLYAQARGESANGYRNGQTTPDVFGGTIGVAAQSGTIRAGALLLYADAAAGFGDVVSGVARGGTVTVDIANSDAGVGTLTLTDCPTYSCVISAGARGGSALAGSDAFGGSVGFTNAGGQFSSTGQLFIQADGRGGRAVDGGNGQGANGTGGAITLANRGGTSSFGQLFMQANGTASEVAEGFFFGSGSGGVGRGGTVNVTQAGGNLTATLLRASANGEGGFAGVNCVDCTPDDLPFSAGAGIGGTVGFALDGGTVQVNLLSFYADGIGGAASSGDPTGDIAGLAGNGTGGRVDFTGLTGGLIADSIILSANGQGGLTLDAVNLAPNSGGNGTGGGATFTMAANGVATVATPNLIVRAEGIGGNAGRVRRDPDSSLVVTARGAGGGARGGDAGIVLAGGTLTATSISLSAEGTGGDGSVNETPGSGGSGGAGVGGNALLTIASSGHGLIDTVVSADGEGGQSRDGNAGVGGTGGNATGGTARVAISASGTATRMTIAADGAGSDGSAGAIGRPGGSAAGGRAELAISAGTFTFTDQLKITADGDAGTNGGAIGSSTFAGGNGAGGIASVALSGESTILRIEDIAVSAKGTGGAIATTGAGTGGNGTGGASGIMTAAGATLEYAGLLDLSTAATSGAGGEARGGTSTFQVDGGRVNASAGSSLRIGSDAQYAGISQLLLTNATTALGDVTLSAVADIVPGRPGRGGQTLIRVQGDGVSAPGATSVTANVSANNGGTAGVATLINEAVNGSLAVSGPLSFTSTGTTGFGNIGIAVRSNGNAVTASDVTLTSSGGMSLIFAGAGGLRASGAVDLQSGGQIALSHATPATGATSIVAGTAMRLSAYDGIVGQSGTRLASGGDAVLETEYNDIRLSGLAATGDASLIARRDGIAPGDGSLNVTRGFIVISDGLAVGGRATLSAPSGIDVLSRGDLDVASAVTGPASSIAINAIGNLTVESASAGTIGLMADAALSASNLTAASGGIQASANGDLSLTQVRAQGDVFAQTRGGNMALSFVRAAALDLGAFGNLVAVSNSQATAGDFIVRGGSVTINDSSAFGRLTVVGGADIRNSSSGSLFINGGPVSLSAVAVIGDADLTATTLAMDNVRIGGGLTVLGQQISANDVSAASFDLLASDVRLTNNVATAGGVTVSGTDVSLDGVTATQIVNVDAGTVTATAIQSGSIAINASEGVTLVRAQATTGGIAVTSGSDATLSDLMSRDGIAARADGNLSVADVTGAAVALDAIGTIDVRMASATAGAIQTTSGGDTSLNDLDATGAILARSGGTLAMATIDAPSVSAEAAGAIDLRGINASAGTVTATSSGSNATLAAIRATGEVMVRSAGALSVTDAIGTALTLEAGGDVALGNSRATTGAVNVSGTNVALTDVSAAGALAAQARRALSAATISGTSLNLTAGGGIDLANGTATAGGLRAVSDSGLTTLRTVTARDDIIASAGGTLAISDAQSAAVAADAVGDLTLSRVASSSGDIRVRSSAGVVRLADATSANDLIVRAGNAVIDGQTRARGLADIVTPGAIAVNGQLTGGTVALTSSDLAIAAGGAILAAPDAQGSSGVLTLNATGSGTTFLGGPANGGGYSLSGTEMAALRGRSMTINANGAIEVGSFTMATGANGNFAADGALSILSPTTIRVNGAVRIDAMPKTATLVLGATQRIVVDPATGLIDLRSDGAGGLGGLLRLRSNAVYVATDAAITAIAGMTDPTLIDARLAQNDGIVRPDNIVRAIDIVLDVAEGAYIQNLGAGTAYDQRRGFLATGSTLYIDTTSADTRVVINGQLQADGLANNLLSGLSVAPIIMVNGVRGPAAGGRFDQRSTVNGCLMINSASCQPRTIAPEQAALSQSSLDAIDRVLNPNPLLSFTPFLLAAIELRDYVPQAYLPLIDEPVTGAGNDDLWQCDDDQPGCARPNP